MAYSTSQAARLAKISATTVRVYTADYGDFFSQSSRPPKGYKRAYTDQDIALLLTIRRLKSEQKTEQAIIATLREGERDNFVPPESSQEDAPSQSAIVMQLTATVAKFEGELTAVKRENDRLIQQLQDERQARIEAEKQAANLAGKLDAIQTQEPTPEPDTAPARPPSWWDRVRGRRN